jgi:CRISPR-associated endonuclease Csn1
VDKDHIVPRSERTSDSLESLVVTFAEVNKWKGRRTALQFVTDEGGKPVPGAPNLSIMTLREYKEAIEGLSTKGGHDGDHRRKKKRKELLGLKEYTEKEFTPRDRTQTSQVVRLGAQVLRKVFGGQEPAARIVSLPGSVTGTVRRSWNLLGCLSKSCPTVLGEDGSCKTKTEIRDITHLHHALDACVLGLAGELIPNSGSVWELIVKRHVNSAEERQMLDLGIFEKTRENRVQLKDLPPAIKDQIREKLAEKRVVQHVPARMSGLRLEQNTWRVVSVSGGEAVLRQSATGEDGKRKVKEAKEKTLKLLGVDGAVASGKLGKLKGALVIPDNFGVALVGSGAEAIPYHKVWPRLRELRAKNGGKRPVVIRRGQLIQVESGPRKGIWRVFSVKNNSAGIALDIGWPDVVRLRNKMEGHNINVLVASLMKCDLKLVKCSLAGVPSCPFTLST